nr:helix-turn-helix domain-containing protein [Flavonifractor plautii]
MIEDGMTVNEVAERFQTSRQVIGKYLNKNRRKAIHCA